MSVGLLVARLVIGLAMAAHGAQKLFGWFGGYGFQGTAGFLAAKGYRPAPLFTFALAAGELASGALTALGLLGPLGPALMILIMLVALVVGHWGNGFFATTNGIELPVLYATAALALAVVGPGRLSLDRLLGLQGFWTPRVAWIAIAAAVVGAVLNLAVRRPEAPPAPRTT